MANRRRTISPPVPPHVRADAGAALLNDLQRLFCVGDLTAKTFCELAYNATKAGAVGDIKDWGMAPSNDQTGHFSRHVERMIRRRGFHVVQPALLEVPCQPRASRSRTTVQVGCRPFHELLHHDVNQPARMVELRHKLATTDWPDVYRNHDVVARATPGELVLPLGVFIDAAQYGGAAAGRDKSILVMSVVDLCTHTRHVGIVFRKHLQCRCGCKGYCSVYRLLTFLRWSVESLAAGEYPMFDWDSRKFTDAARQNLGGKPLGFKGAVCYMMADWEGVCSHYSVPTWKSNLHCCPLCNAPKTDMYMFR